MLLAAVGVAIVTGIGILTLPQSGTLRYGPNDPRSSLGALRASLTAIGYNGSEFGVIQHLVPRGTNPAAFRAATYWTAADVENRRDGYLAAGALLMSSLLIGAFVTGYPRPQRTA